MNGADYLAFGLGALIALFVCMAFQVLSTRTPPGVVRGGFGGYFRGRAARIGAAIHGAAS